MPHLAVVILNYNTRDLLRLCLRSVLDAAVQSTDRLVTTVFVVDSASTDESAAMVAAEFPQAHLIASPVNLGYTGGNNLALHLLGFPVDAPPRPHAPTPPRPTPHSPDYVLLLNADTEIAADALWQLVAALQTRPDAGACGARLTYGSGEFQHGAFHFPTLMQLVLDLWPLSEVPVLRRFWRRLADRGLNGRYPVACWDGDAPFAVDFVLGAALMMRAEAIRQVGGLDDGYFMYCEEMDWCLRLADAGWAVLAVPAAQVVHHEGQSSRQVRWPAYERLWRSRFRFYRKHAQHYPLGYLWLVRLVVRIGVNWRAWLAERRFAHGLLTGEEAASELQTYQTIRAL
jgi:N-acetylglucosaminyl-diphospho-decaprenol L-rhamnosyltransferase